MIVCAQCQSALREDRSGLTCDHCGTRVAVEEGMLVFNREILPDHEDYQAEGLDALYQYEQKHFWFKHRLKLILSAFRRHVGKTESIMEVGAGTGHTARALMDARYSNLSIGEIHRNGLLYAKGYGLNRLYQFDLRSPPFLKHFDAVGLFDVLEHLRDDDLIVRNLSGMLKEGGRIILTVPAHEWLWSRIDELSGHQRRYDRTGLMKVLERNGFDVLECRYMFTALVPAFLVRSFLARGTSKETINADSGIKVSSLSNAVFGVASELGDVVCAPLNRLVGGSLLAVARKKA
jgi:2-polyprenyl-3-methyl-5-hydroxy-6-metoxy-1,4-benzoquinol methylase